MSLRPIQLARTRVRRKDAPIDRDPRFAELDQLIAEERERERDRERERQARHHQQPQEARA